MKVCSYFGTYEEAAHDRCRSTFEHLYSLYLIIVSFIVFRWVNASVSDGVVPTTALQGGVDMDKKPIYVGRAYHEGDLIPAKIIPGRMKAYVAHHHKENSIEHFQILCGQRFAWVETHGTVVPPGAVQGGYTKGGEPYYIGRAKHEGSQLVGKIHPSLGSLYIPFDGHEFAYSTYEALVITS